jgi:2-polyprenyl-3-methyl-5-hydroxy-6-metoxy-1,4-benzoquinol methylase
MTASKTDRWRDAQVEEFFSDPDRYRRRNADLPIRPTVVRRLLGSCRGQSILDLGCGDGSLTIPMCGEASRLVLLDRSAAMLDEARRGTPPECSEHVSYVEADLDEYEPRETFDVLVCVGVLAHVRSIADTVERVARLLSPGGRCIIQFTDGRRPLGMLLHASQAIKRWRGDGTGYRPNYTTARAVGAMSRSTGLRVVRTEYYSVVLPGLNRLPLRWRQRYTAWSLEHPLPRLSSEVMLLLTRE